MEGRYFSGRKISCFFWDGKTDYKKPPESEEETKRRIEDFGKWLEGDNNAENENSQSEGEEPEIETEKKP